MKSNERLYRRLYYSTEVLIVSSSEGRISIPLRELLLDPLMRLNNNLRSATGTRRILNHVTTRKGHHNVR